MQLSMELNYQERFSDLCVLSMGLGQDSHAILYKLVHDEAFRARYAPDKLLVLFAETGNEHPFTYQYMNEVTIPFCKTHGIEFVHITPDMGYHGNTWTSLTHQWSNGRPTIGSVAYPKTCTHNLKLMPQYRFMEDYLCSRYNLPKIQRKQAFVHFAKYHGKIRWLIGIAKGEEKRVQRAEDETVTWKKCSIVVEYPLIDIGYDRAACQAYITQQGYALPMPSNCMYCPYGSKDMELLWMYYSYPDRFQEWAELEQKKLEAHTDAAMNLGVCGKLHREGPKKGLAVTLLDLIQEYLVKHPDITLSALQEYKWSHGHCVVSRY